MKTSVYIILQPIYEYDDEINHQVGDDCSGTPINNEAWIDKEIVLKEVARLLENWSCEQNPYDYYARFKLESILSKELFERLNNIEEQFWITHMKRATITQKLVKNKRRVFRDVWLELWAKTSERPYWLREMKMDTELLAQRPSVKIKEDRAIDVT